MIVLHKGTFEYLNPTEMQKTRMSVMRVNFRNMADAIADNVPPGADRDYALRLLRSAASWVNIAITRKDDGTPRE